MTPTASRLVALGALLGLAWSAAMRGYMVELAGRDSCFDWVGTFVLILLPGVVIGAGLGWAEFARRTGGRAGWRWLAVLPALFGITALLAPGAFLRFVTTGIGGGAVAVSLTAILGGYAISRRGPLAGRIAAGVVGLTMLASAVVSGWLANPDLVPTEPRGAWVIVLALSLMLVLVLASSIPHRPVARSVPQSPPD
jgi:hypothetical protein